jgi:hypothetical protein
MFRRSSPKPGAARTSGAAKSGGSTPRVEGAMVGTGLALLQRGHRRAAQEWFDLAGQKTKDPWLLEALGEIMVQLGDLKQPQRYTRRSEGTPLDPTYSFPLLAQELDLTARPEQAAKDGAVPHAGSVNLAERWQEKGQPPAGDARALCCMGIYLALTGHRDQAGNWLGLAGHRLAEGPGTTPASFGLLDCEAQVGMLSGLIEPLADGLPLD